MRVIVPFWLLFVFQQSTQFSPYFGSVVNVSVKPLSVYLHFSCMSNQVLLIPLFDSSLSFLNLLLIFFSFVCSPPLPKGIQAPQPAVSQPAAAVGHHWVSSYTHIRQTVCWDGLRHLGWRRELGSFLLSQKPYMSAPLTCSHSPLPNTQYFSLCWTSHVSTLIQ